MQRLRAAYPWIKQPLIVSAPMLGAATPQLAVNVSKAGGIGFIAGGTNPDGLRKYFEQIKAQLQGSKLETLPIGVGFQLFNTPLEEIAKVIEEHLPSIVWLFAAKRNDDYRVWAERIRTATGRKTAIWVQVGNVAEAKEVLDLVQPDVLILQGTDAGGHGLKSSASIVSLVPEVVDILRSSGKEKDIPLLAAGGIVEARAFAAALTLGASGVVMGTRFLAASEAGIAEGWKAEVIKTNDGGASTIRSTLCDRLKETKGWPEWYDGRQIKNQGHVDEGSGLTERENVELYKEEMKREEQDWGVGGRLVAYAGTGVGLVRDVKPAGDIVETLRAEVKGVLGLTARDVQSIGEEEAQVKL